MHKKELHVQLKSQFFRWMKMWMCPCNMMLQFQYILLQKGHRVQLHRKIEQQNNIPDVFFALTEYDQNQQLVVYVDYTNIGILHLNYRFQCTEE